MWPRIAGWPRLAYSQEAARGWPRLAYSPTWAAQPQEAARHGSLAVYRSNALSNGVGLLSPRRPQ
jgi:hypothetical protein